MPDLPLSDLDVAGARVMAWVREYLAHPERYPVLPNVSPGDVRRALPAAAPRTGEPLDVILDDFERVILPGLTHWNHPGFFAYFAISSSIPGILGETLAAALDVNGMLWKSSPAATELEQVVLDWLRAMLGLPEESEGRRWFGMITDTASISSMLALAAARESRPGLDVRERGLAGRPDLPALRVYCSEHAHSSIDKGAITLGLGHANVVKVPTDAGYRMRADALRSLVEADVSRGMLPIATVATVGTTSVTSVDPVREIAAVCRAHGMWLHVDGAYGGVAGLVPELRWAMDGVELADSLVVNPHKWLFTPVDCSALWTRHPEVLKRAFSLVPEYLVTGAGDDVVNYMDYGVQLGRRFRALKLWMVIRAFGVEGLAARIATHCALARELAAQVAAEPEWEVCAPVPFSLVCFRHVPGRLRGDEAALAAHNQRLMDAVNATGRAFLSHTRLGERWVLRLAIGNIRTERAHVAEAWRLLREAAASAGRAPAGTADGTRAARAR